jgi:DNA (cytosine-5)-methyltransferase 1
MLHGLDLFSGIGGISLALQPWVRTVCYVENEPYAQQVLRERIADGRLDDAPIWDDVRTFDPGPWRGLVDIVAGGFPCQDISTAGRGAGLAGERSGLFFEIARIADVLRPRFIFLENVAAICADGRGGWDVVGALAALGYDARWGVLSAFEVGAPHLRERWWCLAHARGQRRQQVTGSPYGHEGENERGAAPNPNEPAGRREGRRGRNLADAESLRGPAIERDEPDGVLSGVRDIPNAASQRGREGLCWAEGQGPSGRTGHADQLHANLPQPGGTGSSQRQGPQAQWAQPAVAGSGFWATEPDVGRVAHGIPARVDRLRGLGNSVVPACAREAFRRLLEGEG